MGDGRPEGGAAGTEPRRVARAGERGGKKRTGGRFGVRGVTEVCRSDGRDDGDGRASADGRAPLPAPSLGPGPDRPSP